MKIGMRRGCLAQPVTHGMHRAVASTVDKYHLPLRILYGLLEHADHRRQPHASADQHDRRAGAHIDMETAIWRGQPDLVSDVDMIVQQAGDVAWRVRAAALAFDRDAVAASVWHIREAVLQNLLQN